MYRQDNFARKAVDYGDGRHTISAGIGKTLVAQTVSEYQLRAFRGDGELSLVMLTPAMNNDDARAQACALITGQVPTVEIWLSDSLVDTLRIRGTSVVSSIVGKNRVQKP